MDLWTYMKGDRDTDFWHLSSGEHQNLLDEAIDYIAKLHQQLDGVRDDNAHLKQQPAAENAKIKEEHRMFLVGLLRKQAKEIAQGNIYGWGNTMTDAATCICELEAEIAERRMDYGEDCKRLDARIAELEQQLADVGKVNDDLGVIDVAMIPPMVRQLKQQLAAERDKQPHECDECSTVAAFKKALVAAKDEAEHFMELARKNALDFIEVNEQLAAAQEREAAYAEYKRKLEAIVTWLEHNEQSVFARGLWDVLYKSPTEADEMVIIDRVGDTATYRPEAADEIIR